MLYYNTVTLFKETLLTLMKFERLRVLEEECTVTVLKNAIQEGIDSGIFKSFNPAEHLERLKSNKRDNGQAISDET